MSPDPFGYDTGNVEYGGTGGSGPRLVNGAVYTAHILSLDKFEANTTTSGRPRMNFTYNVRVYTGDPGDIDNSIEWRMFSQILGAHEDKPLDLRFLQDLVAKALDGDIPKDENDNPAWTEEHGKEWWAEAPIGMPIKVKVKVEERNGKQYTNIDAYQPWKEGQPVA